MTNPLATKYPAVYWSEGMFLSPHHFQAADRHWREQLALSSRWNNAYDYGWLQCAIDVVALANAQFQVDGLACRLGDGTLFVADQLPRRDLKAALGALGPAQTLEVRLAVSKTDMSRANVAWVGSDVGAGPSPRFLADMVELADESSGGNEQQIGVLKLHGRILLAGEDDAGCETLPICRVLRQGSQGAVPEIDPGYVPPLLAIDAWPPLAQHIVRALYDRVGAHGKRQSEILNSRAANVTSPTPADAALIHKLQTLLEAQAALGSVTFAKGVHPFIAYRELCRIYGGLAVFGESLAALDMTRIPPYDHDDLATVFQVLKKLIEALLKDAPEDYKQLYFEGTSNGMFVKIPELWLEEGWDWFVGVCGMNVPENVVRSCLAPGTLNWKLASDAAVAGVFSGGFEGLKLEKLDRPPEEAKAEGNWCFYRLSKSGDDWTKVLTHKSLAIRFADSFIGNRATLPRNRILQVNLQGAGPSPELQFALFAVRPK